MLDDVLTPGLEDGLGSLAQGHGAPRRVDGEAGYLRMTAESSGGAPVSDRGQCRIPRDVLCNHHYRRTKANRNPIPELRLNMISMNAKRHQGALVLAPLLLFFLQACDSTPPEPRVEDEAPPTATDTPPPPVPEFEVPKIEMARPSSRRIDSSSRAATPRSRPKATPTWWAKKSPSALPGKRWIRAQPI